eukprot:363994-Chlamydomonas_euryale.AAC.2
MRPALTGVSSTAGSRRDGLRDGAGTMAGLLVTPSFLEFKDVEPGLSQTASVTVRVGHDVCARRDFDDVARRAWQRHGWSI